MQIFSGKDYAPLTGRVLPTFVRFTSASLFGLLALSSAAIVDGILVGKLLGADELAAVNLLIPYLTLVFGIALMLAIGGSVECGHLLGRNKTLAANATFTRTLVAVAVFAVVVIVAGLLFSKPLFRLLAVPAEVAPLLSGYFHILLLGVPAQLLSVVLYYFLRTAGNPRQASAALVAGAAVNILADVFFLLTLKLDLRAAAWATVLAQCVQCAALVLFFRRQTVLGLHRNWKNLKAFLSSSANGFSEFINEISAGLVLLAIHWLLSSSQGAAGVAGFALVNYSLLLNVMTACAVAEVVHLLVSQNMGAGQTQRARQFRNLGFVTVLAAGAGLYLLVMGFGEAFSGWLFSGESNSAAHHARSLWPMLAPVFLLAGCNMVFSAWFTGLQQAGVSSAIALSRSLTLPLAGLAILVYLGAGLGALWALALAEALTLLVVTLWFFMAKRKPVCTPVTLAKPECV